MVGDPQHEVFIRAVLQYRNNRTNYCTELNFSTSSDGTVVLGKVFPPENQEIAQDKCEGVAMEVGSISNLHDP